MKIMYDYQVFSSQEYGGVSRYHIELKKAIDALEKTESKIVAPFSINYYLQEFGVHKWNYPNQRVIRKAMKIVGNSINKLYCEIESRKNDIVHATWYDPYILKSSSNKLVVTIHDMIHEIYWSERAKKEIEHKKQFIYKSSAIIAISENTKKDILRFYPDIPEEKISVVYHGTNHLPKACKPDKELPDKYILYVGQREDYKNATFFIRAMKEILDKYEDIKLLFVGGNEFSEDEISVFKELNIDNRVMRVKLNDAELAYIYNKAVCFVYPSLYEGFGFPILEAFDNECPVICTNSSSLPEVGRDAAMYFNEGDVDMLQKYVVDMLEDNDLRKKYIMMGKERVKDFTWEKCAKETLEVYKKIFFKE